MFFHLVITFNFEDPTIKLLDISGYMYEKYYFINK